MTPTHTPAAQPAGEMDDAALVEATARALCVHDGVDPESFIYNCETYTVPAWRHYVDEARVSLAIARPVIQAQALDEAALDGEALIDTGRKLERAKVIAYLDNKLQRMGLAHEGHKYIEAVRNHIKDTMP